MTNSSMLFNHPKNITGMSDFFFKYSSELLGGYAWGYMILLSVFAISFISLSNRESSVSFGVSSFITFVTATLLVPLGAMDIRGWVISTILIVFATIYNLNRGGGGQI